MPSTKLSDLHLDLLPLCELFLYDCRQAGLDIKITCTFRSNDEQSRLYAQGRTAPGAIVTNAKAGQSEHNFLIDGYPAAKAFDLVPMWRNAPDWVDTSIRWAMIGSLWTAGNLIKRYYKNGFYLDWYGRPGAKFRELPHFCLKKEAAAKG